MEINKGRIIIGVSRRSARWRFGSLRCRLSWPHSLINRPPRGNHYFLMPCGVMIGPSESKIRKVLKKFLKQIMNFFFLHVLWSSLTLYLSLSHSLILLFLIINAVNNLSHKISIYLALQAFTSEVSKYKLSWSVDQ